MITNASKQQLEKYFHAFQSCVTASGAMMLAATIEAAFHIGRVEGAGEAMRSLFDLCEAKKPTATSDGYHQAAFDLGKIVNSVAEDLGEQLARPDGLTELARSIGIDCD